MSMNTYKPKDFAKMLGVTVRTLQKWDVAGKLKAFRTPTNRRFIHRSSWMCIWGTARECRIRRK